MTVLAAVEAARLDLDPGAEPSGTLRVGGFATAVRRDLLPITAELAQTHPRLLVHLHEYEPLEAFEALARDDLDLVLGYDYDLAPASVPSDVATLGLWTTAWGLGVPAADGTAADTAEAVVAAYADRSWIVNSRNSADEDAVRTLASLAGFTPRIAHRIDNLDLVEDMVAQGYGVGLLPQERPVGPDVVVLPLRSPGVTLRAFAAHRRGREAWPPLRLLLDALADR